MRRLGASLILLGVVLHPFSPVKAVTGADGGIQSAPEYYFWNQVTGDVQWEDPGGILHTFIRTALYPQICMLIQRCASSEADNIQDSGNAYQEQEALAGLCLQQVSLI